MFTCVLFYFKHSVFSKYYLHSILYRLWGRDGRVLPTVGSPYWIAPEALNGMFYNEKVSVILFSYVLGVRKTGFLFHIYECMVFLLLNIYNEFVFGMFDGFVSDWMMNYYY